jgi:dTMP kinase
LITVAYKKKVRVSDTSKQNSKKRGIFIVIEGNEGSDKSTQLRLLAAQLDRAGHEVAVFNFPQYDKASGYFISQYRKGEYGNVKTISPYAAALFYALDQFDAGQAIEEALEQGKVVLCNHFAASVMAQQSIKLGSVEERRGFFIWLDNLVFETLAIPRPDLNLILRIPAELSHSTVVEAFDDLCKLFPKDFNRIDCVRGGELLSTSAINKLVSEKTRALLPEILSKYEEYDAAVDDAQDIVVAPLKQFITPPELDDDTAKLYRHTISAILESHAHMIQRLTAYLEEQSGTAQQDRDAVWQSAIQAQADQVLQAVLPIATDLEQHFKQPTQADAKLETMVKDLLSTTHSDTTAQRVLLSNVYPRNEIDLVPDLVYSSSDVPYTNLRAQTDTWSYEQKAVVLTSGLAAVGLANVTYRWDIVGSYATFCMLHSSANAYTIQWQPPTPRMGYSVPRLIENAELTDEFEACFDASLKLYSQLQHKGFEIVASNAALFGHRMRWNITVNGSEFKALLNEAKKSGVNAELSSIAIQMYQKLSETHPLIAKTLLDR